MFLYKIIQIIFYLPFKLIFFTRTKGRKNLVKGGAVLVCNHQSYFDVFVLATSIYKYQVFMAKKQLFQKPIIGAVLKGAGAISVDREKIELSSIKKALTALKNEKYLTIFPQGTRIFKGKMENLKNGGILLAVKSNKPIIPIWIEKRPRPFVLNKVVIGKPIYPESFNLVKEDLTKEIETQILNFYKTFEK